MKSGSTNELPTTSEWDRWVDRHAPKLLLFARQQSRCEADAQDVVQEAIVESWQRQTDNAPPPLSLVFATIRRRAIDLARSQERRTRRETVAQTSPECWFDHAAEDRERVRLIQVALGQLPAMYREVITLRIWGELTFAELAEVLGLPVNTAASRYRYGLDELRKLTKEVLT